MLQGCHWGKAVCVFAFRVVLNGLQNALGVLSLPPYEHTYIYVCVCERDWLYDHLPISSPWFLFNPFTSRWHYEAEKKITVK